MFTLAKRITKEKKAKKPKSGPNMPFVKLRGSHANTVTSCRGRKAGPVIKVTGGSGSKGWHKLLSTFPRNPSRGRPVANNKMYETRWRKYCTGAWQRNFNCVYRCERWRWRWMTNVRNQMAKQIITQNYSHDLLTISNNVPALFTCLSGIYVRRLSGHATERHKHNKRFALCTLTRGYE
ncbi:unnamed protein product [Trypanosoma congolense IL3000]|uniref:WGS project CAEQ00000000 data, annotated contig 630 n=1 Tax=Trypanosoma congolense (strain IL3000) TaxID=1068625 RepID=F9WHD3_TRYCI|nr:unnamed protein product [Trypanosoma congolense IL3000]